MRFCASPSALGARPGDTAPPRRQNGDAQKHVPPSGSETSTSPSQFVQLALIRPILHLSDVAMADRIMTHVLPLIVVTLARAQLAIPMFTLPYGTPCHFKIRRCKRLPILHPLLQ